MEEKMEQLYQEYLNEKLDLIFNSGAGESIDTKISFKSSCKFEYNDHGYAIIKKNDKYNIVDRNNNLMLDEWYDYIEKSYSYYSHDIYESYYTIYKNGQRKILNEETKEITDKWYDKIEKMRCGCFEVSLNGKWNLINTRCKLLSENWYDEIENFTDGFACVKLNGKYNFINLDGNIVSNKWYDEAQYFTDGFACVKLDGKYNFINSKGELLSEKWYDFAASFIAGYGLVQEKDSISFINRNGKLTEWYSLTEVTYGCGWYDGYHVSFPNGYEKYFEDETNISNDSYAIIGFFYDGYAKIKKDDKFNFIDINGNLLSDIWYEDAEDFVNGFAIVKKTSSEKDEYIYNFINTKGELVCKEWYDSVYYFTEGYAVVKKNGKCNFVDENGKIFSDKWFSNVWKFNNNYAVVFNGYEYNFIDKNGNYLSENWYDEIENFTDGFAKIRKNKQFNFIDEKGNLLSEEWFDKAESFENGFANVSMYENHMITENYIDSNGQKVYTFNSGENGKIKIPSEEDINKAIDIKNYKIKKKLFNKGYKLLNSYGKFNIKYQPIKNFGFKYVICLNVDEFYLCNLESQEYENLGKINEVVYDENFIMCDDKIYLIYDDKKIDVTDYCNKNLRDKKKVNITPNIEILSKTDFDFLNSKEKEKFLQEEKEKNKKIKEQQAKLKQEQDIKNAEKATEEEKSKLNLEVVDTLIALKDNINKLNELRKRLGNIKIPKIIVDNVLVEVDDHKEIINELKDKLQFIDLSTINFEGVDISGIDFKGCNIHLFPQEVYNRDLRNCDFTGINLDPFINFRGVDIRGASFSMDNDPSTLDIMPKFTGAIYDETTTYNGKSLVDILGPCEEIKNEKK